MIGSLWTPKIRNVMTTLPSRSMAYAPPRTNRQFPLPKVFKANTYKSYLPSTTPSSFILIQHNNLTQKEWTKLRAELSSSGFVVKAVSNGIMKVVLRENPATKRLEKYIEGPIAIVYSAPQNQGAQDTLQTSTAPSQISSVLKVAEKQKKVKVLAGMIDQGVFPLNSLTKYSKLPSIEQSRSELLGVLEYPGSQLCGLLSGPAQNLLVNLEQREKDMRGPEGGEEKEK
ncbi:hypothetical protein BKA69DRAFT_1037922 [Paraphysoderma sedebokerense]|nr:hypothetical protein BKA69DRAFT_1037922 [Paraphysoderma sedebokerense]